MRIPILFALVALLALPLAAAQAPTAPSPTLTVAISGAPAQVPEMTNNATANVAFSVDVTLSGTLCPQGGTIPITVTATQKTPAGFFSVVLDTPDLSITLGTPGPYLATPFSGSAAGSFTATTKEILANASIPIELVATAGVPTGQVPCTPAPSAATSAPVTVYANLTAPPPPPMPEPTPEDKGFLPGFSALHGTLAAIVAVVLLRRR